MRDTDRIRIRNSLRPAGFISLILSVLCLTAFFTVMFGPFELRLKAVYLTAFIIGSKVCFWTGVILLGKDYYNRNRDKIRNWFKRHLG